LQALGTSADSEAARARRFLVLNEHDPWLRRTAVAQLGRDTATLSRAVVRSALRDPDSDVRAQALATLTAVDPGGAKAAAQAMYADDPNETVRETALGVLAREAGGDALPDLVAACAPGHALGLRFVALEALRQVGGPVEPRADALERLTVASEPRELRSAALDALAALDATRAASVAERALRDGDALFAVKAVQVLARVGGAASRERLETAEKVEPRARVRAAIADALHQR
jgi:HEAT repeat protein